MWRADRPTDDFLVEPELIEPTDDHARATEQVTAPHALSFAETGIVTSNAAEPVWAQWRSELSALGGPSSLLHFVDSPRSRIELSTTHPGGLAPW